MKRFLCLVICVMCLLVGCAPREEHLLARFREGFVAECAGVCGGVSFTALFEAAPLTEAGLLPLTVTFYAPKALEGTVLTRRADGSVSLALDGMEVEAGLLGLRRILDAFPATGEISDVTVSPEGHTVVNGTDFSVHFLADGTPLSVRCGAVQLQVVRWEASPQS